MAVFLLLSGQSGDHLQRIYVEETLSVMLHLFFTYKPYLQFLLLLAVAFHASLGIRVILLDFNLAKITSARRLVPWTLGLGVAAAVIAWFAIY